jgi:MFS family permease
MATDERRGCIIIASLCVIEFFIAAPCISLFGVFFGPFMREFHWTHAQVSQTATSYSLVMGLSAPILGWLIERVRVQWVMAWGALVAGAGYLLASQAHSLMPLVLIFAAIGLGNQASTTLPGIYVAATWFENRRGLSIGVMLAGMSAGMVVAPPAITHVILRYGWRPAIALVGVPMILVAAPVSLLFVRTRAATTGRRGRAHDNADLPGLELGPALRSAAFWLIISLEFFFHMVFGAVYFHIVPYLISIGFSAQRAANIFGVQASLAAVGWLITGHLSDRYSPKLVMEGALFFLSVSVIGLLGAKYNIAFITLFLMFWAATAGTASTAVPLLIGQTFGLRRFASLSGIIFVSRAVGIAVSPIITGKLIDFTGTYSLAFEVALVYAVICAVSTALIFPVPGHDALPGQEPALVPGARVAGSTSA